MFRTDRLTIPTSIIQIHITGLVEFPLIKAHPHFFCYPALSPHVLRHTHAVHLLESGVNIKYVSERLGHASMKVTADTYLHVTKKIEDDALTL